MLIFCCIADCYLCLFLLARTRLHMRTTKATYRTALLNAMARVSDLLSPQLMPLTW